MSPLLSRTNRYAQVGLLCALLNNLVVITSDRIGIHYMIGLSLAFVTSTIVGYLLHTAYTFRVAATRGAGIRFAIGNVSGFPISMAIMFLLCTGLGLNASIAIVIATALLFAWNFVVAHLAIGVQASQRT